MLRCVISAALREESLVRHVLEWRQSTETKIASLIVKGSLLNAKNISPVILTNIVYYAINARQLNILIEWYAHKQVPYYQCVYKLGASHESAGTK